MSCLDLPSKTVLLGSHMARETCRRRPERPAAPDSGSRLEVPRRWPGVLQLKLRGMWRVCPFSLTSVATLISASHVGCSMLHPTFDEALRGPRAAPPPSCQPTLARRLQEQLPPLPATASPAAAGTRPAAPMPCQGPGGLPLPPLPSLPSASSCRPGAAGAAGLAAGLRQPPPPRQGGWAGCRLMLASASRCAACMACALLATGSAWLPWQTGMRQA